MPANPTPAEGVVVPDVAEMHALLEANRTLPDEARPIRVGYEYAAYQLMQSVIAARPVATTQSAAQTGEVERLRDALERVQYWLRYEVPIGTRSATAMLTVVNKALSQPEPSQ